LNIKTTKDSKTFSKIIKNLNGTVGDLLDIKVPQINGYTASQKLSMLTVLSRLIAINLISEFISLTEVNIIICFSLNHQIFDPANSETSYQNIVLSGFKYLAPNPYYQYMEL